MKILLAKTAGFCMGVRRAVEMVMDAPDEHVKPICTYGPLIHNTQVLDLLSEKGICTLDEIPAKGVGTVLIRAHGVPLQTKQKLREAGFNVIDATCPRVIKVQSIIRKHARKGFACIIVGDRDHPEVIGLLGYAGPKGHVVGSRRELESLPAFAQAIIVAQTTQNTLFFEWVQHWAAQHHPHYRIFDTICDSTERRQAEVKQMAAEVDAVIVVGGRNSGNTQRLVEIAAESGRPAYHIESEEDLDDLDLDLIKSSHFIGLTAGASTPNWVIKRVYRALETLPYKKARGLRKIVFSLQRLLLLTNLYVSLGAGCLGFAVMKLLGLTPYWPFFIIAFLYVQSMHIFNHLTGQPADRYNDPDRASFYEHHKVALSLLAVGAGAIGLLTAYTRGVWPFVVLSAMSLLGLSYNLRVVPESFTRYRYRRIRDLPGSKTFLISAAWGVVTVLFPSLSITGRLYTETLLLFVWATSLVFVRTAFFDILDMQGDRIVGKETIPILLGERLTLKLLKYTLGLNIVLIAVSGALGLIPLWGWGMMTCPAFVWVVLTAYQKRTMVPGIRLEFLVDSHFILAGVIALADSLWLGR